MVQCDELEQNWGFPHRLEYKFGTYNFSRIIPGLVIENCIQNIPHVNSEREYGSPVKVVWLWPQKLTQCTSQIDIVNCESLRIHNSCTPP